MAKVVRELVTKWTYKVDAKQLKDTVKTIAGLKRGMKDVRKESVKFSRDEFKRISSIRNAWMNLKRTIKSTGDEIDRTNKKGSRRGPFGLGGRDRGQGRGQGGGLLQQGFKTFALARAVGLPADLAAGTAAGAGVAAVTGVAASIGAAARKELATIEIGGLLGNEAAGDILLEKLRTFAAKTPFAIEQLRDLTKRLLAGGFGVDEIIPTLSQLGDLTAGNADALNRMLINFIEIRNNNKAFTKDLRQFNNVGIPIVRKLQEQLGVTGEAFAEMVQKGQISFEDVQNAFRAMTGEGGLFFNRMNRISTTFIGLVSNLGDVLNDLAVEFGEIFLPAGKAVAENLIFLVDGLKEAVVWFRETGVAMEVLSGIALALAFAFAPMALVFLGIFLLVEDFIAMLQGRDGVFTGIVESIANAAVAAENAIANLGVAWDKWIDDLKNDFPTLTKIASVTGKLFSAGGTFLTLGAGAAANQLQRDFGGDDNRSETNVNIRQENNIGMKEGTTPGEAQGAMNGAMADTLKMAQQKVRPKTGN